MRKLIFATFFLAASIIVLPAQEAPLHILPAEVNSGYDEWAPVASPEGETLYFTRLGHPQNMGDANAADVWLTYQYANGEWSRAVNAGAPLNAWQNDYIVGIHALGRKIYLYRPDSNTLLYSDRQGRVWQPPMPIEIDSFKLEDKEAHFTFNPNGSTLLLSFADSGSNRDRNIYVCFAKSENRFSSPQLLGHPANSAADETGLWMAADGKSLYFSSDKKGGYGGHDLYLTRRLDDSWSSWSHPQNLAPNINTPDDDLFISMPASGSPVYLLRKSEESAMNIYETELPDSLLPWPVVLLSGTIRDAASGKAVREANAQLFPIKGQEIYYPDGVSGHDGDFQFIIPQGEDFELSAVMNGYFPLSEALEFSGQPLEELDQENTNLLASLHRDLAYAQRDEEIIDLQLHLRELDEQLIQMGQERRALQQSLIAGRQDDPNWTPPSDPELDALRHRHQQYRASVQDTIIPEAYEEPIGGDELGDMKERYNRYVEHQKKQQQQSTEIAEGNPYLWQENNSFDSIQEEVRQGLKEDLAPQVQQELSANMLETVKREVALSLNERERQQLELKENELRNEIRQSFGNAGGQPGNWAAKGQTAETEWEHQLKGDLRTTMEPKVQEELREELKDDIRAALTNDITYWAKKETQEELQAEMNEKLKLQIEQERRKALSSPKEPDVVPPLIPAPLAKAEYQEIQQDLLLVQVEPGTVIPLNTLIFEPNEPMLKPVAYAELNRVLEFLNQNESIVVEIGVHSGGQLSHTNALSLTTHRAKAISNYLIGNGIEESRIVAKGYGKAFPLTDDGSQEAQRQNQRVEMMIITK